MIICRCLLLTALICFVTSYACSAQISSTTSFGEGAIRTNEWGNCEQTNNFFSMNLGGGVVALSFRCDGRLVPIVWDLEQQTAEVVSNNNEGFVPRNVEFSQHSDCIGIVYSNAFNPRAGYAEVRCGQNTTEVRLNGRMIKDMAFLSDSELILVAGANELTDEVPQRIGNRTFLLYRYDLTSGGLTPLSFDNLEWSNTDICEGRDTARLAWIDIQLRGESPDNILFRANLPIEHHCTEDTTSPLYYVPLRFPHNLNWTGHFLLRSTDGGSDHWRIERVSEEWTDSMRLSGVNNRVRLGGSTPADLLPGEFDAFQLRSDQVLSIGDRHLERTNYSLDLNRMGRLWEAGSDPSADLVSVCDLRDCTSTRMDFSLQDLLDAFAQEYP